MTSLRQKYPLRSRKIIKKCIRGILAVFIGWSIASIFVIRFLVDGASESDGSILTSKGMLWMVWVGVLLILLAWKTAYQVAYFFAYFYDSDENNFLIRKGVVAKREITLPYSKITDVYVDQDVLDVMFGLYDLHISTPTVESGKFAHVDGLSRADATALRAMILENINSSESEGRK